MAHHHRKTTAGIDQMHLDAVGSYEFMIEFAHLGHLPRRAGSITLDNAEFDGGTPVLCGAKSRVDKNFAVTLSCREQHQPTQHRRNIVV
jgi:hypothetical protein